MHCLPESPKAFNSIQTVGQFSEWEKKKILKDCSNVLPKQTAVPSQESWGENFEIVYSYTSLLLCPIRGLDSEYFKYFDVQYVDV